MKLKRIEHHFSVCKVKNLENVDLSQEFCFIEKTDEELSVVCITEHVPADTIEQGVLDFSLIGILAKIAVILAEHEIGIFVVSTFNTDYILVKGENFERALQVLEQKGYQVL